MVVLMKNKNMKMEFSKVSLHTASDCADKMTLAEFVNDCQEGYFIDYDGWGHYGTETMESDLSICPSDIIKGNYRKDFTHIYWYNK